MTAQPPTTGSVSGPSALAEACRSVPLNVDRTFTLAGPPGGPCIWTPGVGLAIVGPADQPMVTVRGTAPGTTTLTVTVSGASTTINLEVVDLRRITVALRATRPTGGNTASAQLSNLAARDSQFVSAERDQRFPGQFDATVLVLVRGSAQSVNLTADVTPATHPIDWDAVRNPGDHLTLHAAQPPTPTLAPPAGVATTLSLDATGSFFVRAHARCACGQRHDYLRRVLRLVLVEVTLTDDRTATSVDCFRGPGKRIFALVSGETETGGWENAIALEADFTVVSGGGDGRLYLTEDPDTSAVEGLWCNTVLPSPAGAEMRGTYQGGFTVRTILEQPTHPPHTSSPVRLSTDPQPPQQIHPPVCDLSDDQVNGPRNLPLAGSSTTVTSRSQALGQTWTCRGEDLPNTTLPLFHPEHPNPPITSVEIDYRFRAGFCVWSRSAPWIIGVAHAIRWQAAARWTVTYDATQVNAFDCAQDSRSVVPQAEGTGLTRPADDAGIEVWPPGSLPHLALITY